LPLLVPPSSSRQLVMVPTAKKGFSPDEIASTLNIEVAPRIPHDPKGTAALCAHDIGWAKSKSALAKWAQSTATDLSSFPSTSPQVALVETQEPPSSSESAHLPLGLLVNATEHQTDSLHERDEESSVDVSVVSP